jgi:hypothetical protein
MYRENLHTGESFGAYRMGKGRSCHSHGERRKSTFPTRDRYSIQADTICIQGMASMI